MSELSRVRAHDAPSSLTKGKFVSSLPLAAGWAVSEFQSLHKAYYAERGATQIL